MNMSECIWQVVQPLQYERAKKYKRYIVAKKEAEKRAADLALAGDDDEEETKGEGRALTVTLRRESDGNSFKCNLRDAETIQSLKAAAELKTGVLAAYMEIIFENKALKDAAKTLFDCGIKDQHEVVVRLLDPTSEMVGRPCPGVNFASITACPANGPGPRTRTRIQK